MMTTMIVQQSKWNKDLVLKSQAYDLVLLIRQAQIYALGVKEDINSNGDKFNIGYGIRVETTGAFAQRYSFFTDRNANKVYDSGVDFSENISFKGEVKIDKICGIRASNPSQTICNGNGSAKVVDISFLRPSPDAYITFYDNNAVINTVLPPVQLKIQYGNDSTLQKTVTIESNGQISTE